MAAGLPTGTIIAVSPTASPIPPVLVVITGPPPASIFSTSAMPNVSTNSGRGLLGSTNAAQPAIKCGFSSSSTSSRKMIRSACRRRGRQLAQLLRLGPVAGDHQSQFLARRAGGRSR